MNMQLFALGLAVKDTLLFALLVTGAGAAYHHVHKTVNPHNTIEFAIHILLPLTRSWLCDHRALVVPFARAHCSAVLDLVPTRDEAAQLVDAATIWCLGTMICSRASLLLTRCTCPGRRCGACCAAETSSSP